MLSQRIATAAILSIIALIAFLLGPVALRLLVLLLFIIAAWEFMNFRTDRSSQENISYTAAFSMMPLSFWFLGLPGLVTAVVTIILGFSIREVFRFESEVHQGFPLDSLQHLALAMFYVGVLGTSLFVVVGEFPQPYLLWLLLMVIATDTGAYFGGRAIGGAKLAPRISPNKTRAGAWSGVLSSIVCSFLVLTWLEIGSFELPSRVGIAILSGILVSLLAIVGDLFESLLKRSFGVKDSGTIFPGHGGVLDRLDALLFAAPALFLLARWFL